MFSTNVIYKLDTKGKIRTWQAFADGNSWYTVAGLIDGKKVTSEPKIVEATNVGRSNERNEEEQAIFEATADMEKKLTRGYFLNIDDVGKFDKFKPMLANDYTKLKAPLVYPVWSQPKLDGCVSADGIVETEFGLRTVKEVYEGNDKLILSYNTKTGKLVNKPIIGKYKNVKNTKVHKKWLKITLEDGTTFKVTDTHKVYLPELNVWREAGQLKLDDKVLTV